MKNDDIKPHIRVLRSRYGYYKYKHVSGNLKPLIQKEEMAFGGYRIELIIGLTIFEKFA